jgi:hypothetical protein
MNGSTRAPPMAPAVIVHGLAEARIAVAAACPRRGLTLLSAPGAGVYAGAGWWRGLAEAASGSRPELRLVAVLDCADAPGAALAAIRERIPAIVFTGAEAMMHRLCAIAAGQRTILLPRAPPALDLAGFRAGNPRQAARLKQWLAG